MTQDLNTLICLFHHEAGAQAALEEILQAGIPESNVTLIGTAGSSIDASKSSLAELNVPQKDLDHLLEGLDDGGAILSVSAISDLADKVEAIFRNHKADQIDEADVDDDMSAQALPLIPPQIPLTAGTMPADDDAANLSPLTSTDPYLDDESSLASPAEPIRVIRVFRITRLPAEDVTGTRSLDALNADDALDADDKSEGILR